MRSPSLLAVVGLLVLVASLPSAASPQASKPARSSGAKEPSSHSTAREQAARVSAGRFLLRGTARVDVTNLPARDYPVDALALVAPGREPGAVVLHLRARGYACELRGRVGPGQALALDAGQTCAFEQPGAPPARLRAELRAGSGRLGPDELTLDLTWDVSGTVSAATVAEVMFPGTTALELPPLPVRGTVGTEAHGRREAGASPR